MNDEIPWCTTCYSKNIRKPRFLPSEKLTKWWKMKIKHYAKKS